MDVVNDLWDEIYAFSKMHPEYDLFNYRNILAKYGYDWNNMYLDEVGVSSADGQLVMTLLMSATRAERFCEGTLLTLGKNGSILRWLRRLKEIDEA